MLQKKNNKITYPGLIAAWSAKGKSNDDADRNVLRDLTGNGYDITLNNFAFSEMSGYGGYKTRLNNKTYLDHDTYNFEVTETSIKIENFTGTLNIEKVSSYWTWDEYKIKVIGLNVDEYLRIYYCLGSSSLGWNYIEIRNDGIYTVPQSKMSDSPYNRNPFIKGNFKNVAIQLLPEYPDALVFDGVDDYGDCAMIKANLFKENFTFICKREYITEPSPQHRMTTAYCRAANLNAVVFVFEGFYYNPYINVYNLGTLNLTYDNAPVDYSLNTTFLTPTNYNGHTFEHSGDNNHEDNSQMRIGGHYTQARYANMAFYSAYLFDRSLDEQEIKTFIRKYIDADYLLPSEIPTPDCLDGVDEIEVS